MPVDAMTTYGRPSAPSVQTWFAPVVETPKPDNIVDPIDPVPQQDTVTEWELAKRYAATRPLLRLSLQTDSATAIDDAIAAARAFSASAPRLSVEVDGRPRVPPANAPDQSGHAHVSLTGVHVMSALQLTQAVANLARTLDTPEIGAQVDMEFEQDASRRAAERVVAGIANEDRYGIEATFGPEGGAG
jgi:hypothetical protein